MVYEVPSHLVVLLKPISMTSRGGDTNDCYLFPGIGLEKTTDILERLRGAGYKIFAISEIGREVSFLRQ